MTFQLPQIGDVVEFRRLPSDPWVSHTIKNKSPRTKKHGDATVNGYYARHVSKEGTPWAFASDKYVWRWPDGYRPPKRGDVVEWRPIATSDWRRAYIVERSADYTLSTGADQWVSTESAEDSAPWAGRHVSKIGDTGWGPRESYPAKAYVWRWPQTKETGVEEMEPLNSVRLCTRGVCGNCFGCKTNEAADALRERTWPDESVPAALEAKYINRYAPEDASYMKLLCKHQKADDTCHCMWHTLHAAYIKDRNKDVSATTKRVHLLGTVRTIMARLKELGWVKKKQTTSKRWEIKEDLSKFYVTGASGDVTITSSNNKEENGMSEKTIMERLVGDPKQHALNGLYIATGDQIVEVARKLAVSFLTQDIKKKKKRKEAMKGIRTVLKTEAGEAGLRVIMQGVIRNLPIGAEEHRAAIADKMAEKAAAIPMNYVANFLTGPAVDMITAVIESDEKVKESFKALEAYSSKTTIEVEVGEVKDAVVVAKSNGKQTMAAHAS